MQIKIAFSLSFDKIRVLVIVIFTLGKSWILSWRWRCRVELFIKTYLGFILLFFDESRRRIHIGTRLNCSVLLLSFSSYRTSLRKMVKNGQILGVLLHLLLVWQILLTFSNFIILVLIYWKLCIINLLIGRKHCASCGSLVSIFDRI